MSRYPELGAPFGAIHKNLEELDARQSRLLECRMSHLDEWADTAVRVSGGERDTLLRLLDALRLDREPEPERDTPPENLAPLRDYYRHISLPERIAVLRAVIDRCGVDMLLDPEDVSPAREDGFEISESAAGKIAYVQNTFTDTAYLCFSAAVEHPRAAYFDNFSDVCEEVYNGICEYCILPILHQRDGKLFRFYSLLEKYDLRIVCACDVPWTEKNGVTVTRYALIRKTLPPTAREDTPEYLELQLPADDTGTLGELLQVAALCHLVPERIDTRADEEEPDRLAHRITLRLHEADLGTFLAHLSLNVPRCLLLGLYRVTGA